MKKKVSDFIFEYLVKQGVSDVFMVTGGGIMHLCESIRATDGITYYCNHHEQASAIAAEAYSRMTGKIGVCVVTTGPGSTNALSGIAGAWVDSVPVLVISGQVRTQIMADYSKIRQLGPQEINIDDMARPVTKYFVTITDPYKIKEEVDKCLYHAQNGRPGPVWLNVPLDIQSAEVEVELLSSFIPVEKPDKSDIVNKMVRELTKLINESSRPVIIAGNGIRLGNATTEFIDFIHKVQIPVLTWVGSLDLIGEEDPLNIGRFGGLGQRRANILLQNADLVIAIGASLSIASIGFNFKEFARSARKVMINIDPEEMAKPVLDIDIKIPFDAKTFLKFFLEVTKNSTMPPKPDWFETCRYFREKYPILETELQIFQGYVNTYQFVNNLSQVITNEYDIITGNSLDIWSIFHSFAVKEGQRVFTNNNYGAMGWDLPGVIGACIGSKRKPTILVTGDGSFQFNIQELQTIRFLNLPIVIFVFDNEGYQSIRSTQNNYFNGNFMGSDPSTGILNPNYQYLAKAYEFSYGEILDDLDLTLKIRQVLELKRPALCRINVSLLQERRPRVSSFKHEDGTMEARPLEDMFPFLPRNEIQENQDYFVKKWGRSKES